MEEKELNKVIAKYRKNFWINQRKQNVNFLADLKIMLREEFSELTKDELDYVYWNILKVK